jgi:GNAT superfamily N-acetyltransferase
MKTTDCELFDWGASSIDDGLGFVAVKRSSAGLYKGPSQDVAHVTLLAFKDPLDMVDLMDYVKHCLRDRGVMQLHFGTDTAHLFPGCPTDFHALKDFLVIGGFSEGSEAHDMERDLVDYECKHPLPDGDEFRPLTEQDVPALEDFLLREFPGRWHYDVMNKITVEEDPSTVFGLFHGSEVDGFALIQRDGCCLPIGGSVWRADLGPNWGSLGPIGVSKDLRGRGSGHALLGKALECLRDRGARRSIIDWTGLVKFYGAHGFEVSRTYTYMSLSLEEMLT